MSIKRTNKVLVVTPQTAAVLFNRGIVKMDHSQCFACLTELGIAYECNRLERYVCENDICARMTCVREWQVCENDMRARITCVQE